MPELIWVGFKHRTGASSPPYICVCMLFDNHMLGLCFGHKFGNAGSLSKVYFGLLVFFLLVGLWVVELFCRKLSVCAVFSFFSFPLVSWDFLFCLDSVRVLGGYMLFSCSLVAFVYCFHYFSGGGDSYLLFPLMVWFVGVMALLMFSNSFVFTLVM